MNYTFRMHDPRIGRFFARDPLEKKYPWYSPYQFSGNRLIDMIELEGLEPTNTKVNADSQPKGDYWEKTDSEGNYTGEAYPTSELEEVTVTAVKKSPVKETLRAVGSFANDFIGGMTGASSINYRGYGGKFGLKYNSAYSPSTSSTPALVVLGVVTGGVALEAGALYELGVFTINNGLRSKLIGGFSSFTSQYASNRFDLSKVDYFDVGMSTFFGGGGSTLVKSFVDYKPEGGFGINSTTDAFLNYQSSRFASKFSKFTTTPFKPFLEKSTMGGVIQVNVDTYFKIITTVVKKEIKEDIKGNPNDEVQK